MKIFSPRNPSPPPRRRQTDVETTPSRMRTSEPGAFRRNRTLTGSTSARIASTNETNAELRSPRAHVHHLNRLRRRLLGYCLAIFIAAGVLFVLVNQLMAHIAVEAQGVSLPAAISHAYEQRIDGYLRSRPVERLRFFLNTSELTAYMQQQYPEIASLQIQSSGELGRASASVRLRQPIARWSINDQSRFVDKNGIVFKYNAFSPPSISIVDNSGIPTSGIHSVASGSFLTFVGRVVGDAADRGYTVKSATIPALSIRELDIRLKGVSYRFKMSTDRSAGEQVEDMGRILKYLKHKHITPDYVDVRIPGEAFYK